MEVCHKLLFELLHEVYAEVKSYKTRIYNDVAELFGVAHVIGVSQKQIHHDKDKEKGQEVELTKYLCHFYLRKYFEQLLPYYQRKYGNSKSTIYRDNIEAIEMLKSVDEYVEKVKLWSWCALLQDPELTLFPSTFKMTDSNGEATQFDPNSHKRCFGSDNCANVISYCVWPILLQNNIAVNKMLVEVIVRDQPPRDDKKPKCQPSNSATSILPAHHMEALSLQNGDSHVHCNGHSHSQNQHNNYQTGPETLYQRFGPEYNCLQYYSFIFIFLFFKNYGIYNYIMKKKTVFLFVEVSILGAIRGSFSFTILKYRTNHHYFRYVILFLIKNNFSSSSKVKETVKLLQFWHNKLNEEYIVVNKYLVLFKIQFNINVVDDVALCKSIYTSYEKDIERQYESIQTKTDHLKYLILTVNKKTIKEQINYIYA
ncbi:hypothetical protein RFI_03331 [Reticulomyxa filosa]|uniref:Mitochondria-eating protein C-terminal domain-containing protein n=1 Tax=Reticulomyxa filosa TaxID=46433 RepID=X6P6G4_RETFI|nr:hypothetical protein RFI_03331 [Reticulomyxa filosa]|eukprot:ETO33771.1 hypothetical protein RFI_03331 [Reticulomyxa filosa]